MLSNRRVGLISDYMSNQDKDIYRYQRLVQLYRRRQRRKKKSFGQDWDSVQREGFLNGAGTVKWGWGAGGLLKMSNSLLALNVLGISLIIFQEP